jgi:hypothetical protein
MRSLLRPTSGKTREERPRGKGIVQVGKVAVPVLGSKMLGAVDMDIFAADLEAPAEAEQGIDLVFSIQRIAPEATEERVRHPNDLLTMIAVRRIEEDGCEAVKAEGMRLIPERFKWIDPKFPGRIGGADELDPTEEVGVAAGRRRDRRPTARKAAGDLRATQRGGFFVDADRYLDDALDPGPVELEPHPGQ